jgi:coatomer protein complex subunit gamma
MQHKRKGDDEDTDAFHGVERNAVLREAPRIFSERDLDAHRCISVLTKLAYLLAQGERFTGDELTSVFFSMTKLFQSPDVHLRRMVYLLIKELQVGSDESMIVINCLQKDMNSQISTFRANSICVLAKIMDPSMVGGIERFLRQALVDRNPHIVASTLVAGHTLLKENPEIVKRWTNEIQEGLNNSCKMVQYHSLSLLYKLKRHDKLSLSKVASALARRPPIGAQSQCVVIRMIFNLLSGRTSIPDSAAPLLQYVVDCLHNRSFMVMYEAARAMCRLECLTPVQLAPAVCVLQEFLSSPIPVQRFAAVRTLADAVVRFPMIVAPCSVELEACINDSNRSIATLAISTLLKTGVEANVDRLMKTIIGFMSEISDEFKIVLVDAIQTLCLKFPHKHSTLTSFLANSLREEGGLKLKQAIVTALLTIVESVPEALETGLEHFCEFIEDCEYAALAVQVLHFLGDQASKASNPTKFIRFIFNRVILEAACVRSAAVAALGKIGCSVPSLRENVCVLLTRCMNDVDDEVRDRVVFYLELLSNARTAQITAGLVFGDLPVSFTDLEHSLQIYLGQDSKAPFNLNTNIVAAAVSTGGATVPGASSGASASQVASSNMYEDLLASIPELKGLGKVFKSSEPVDLTEQESEYVVSCVKHVFARHAVFQFNVENRMEGTLLENATVDMELDEENEDWMFEFAVSEPKIMHGESGTAFVCFSRPEDSYTSGSFESTLRFVSKEVYGDGEIEERGARDECELDEIEMAECDFMNKGPSVGLPEFKQQWETLTNAAEVQKRYALGLSSVQAAVDAVLSLVNMRPCENTHIVPEGASTHGIQLTGTFFGNHSVFCRAGFRLNANGHGVTLAIAVRCSNSDVATLIANAVR